MRTSFVAAVVVLGLTFFAGEAYAVDFDFDVTNTTIAPGSGSQVINTLYPQLSGQASTLGPQLETQLQPTVNALVAQLKQSVNGTLGPLNFAPFLKWSARGQAAVGKGTTADYASWMKIAGLSIFGAGASAPASETGSVNNYVNHIDDNVKAGNAPPFGAGANAGLTLALSLAPYNLKQLAFFDPSRLTLYASAFYMRLNFNNGDATAAVENFGLYAKYQLFKPRALGTNLLRWGGLGVTSGLGYSQLNARFHTTLPSSSMTRTQSYNNQSFNVRATWSGVANLGLRNDAWTWPIEAATSIELAYAFTFYGGVGVDFNFGSSRLTAGAKEPVSVSAVSSDGQKSVALVTPLPQLTYNQVRKPQVADVRAFAGLQLGAAVAGAFLQAAIDSTQTLAISSGLRLFW